MDAKQGRSELSNFKAGYTALMDQLRRPLNQIASLRDLQSSLVENDRQLNAVRDKVRDLANELISAERPTKAQQMAYRAATADAKSLEQAIASQKSQLAQLSASLKAAGVDTNYLSNEQKRLTADLAQASRAADQQARVEGARAALGIRPHREIRNEVAQLQRQYQTLQRVGGLSSAELAQAQVRLRERTAELLEGTNGWAKSLGQVHVQAGVALASMGALVYGGSQLLQFYARFAQEMAAVDSITNMTRPELQAMSRDVRQLSVDMGRDAAQSAAALNDILSSGVSEKNGLSVLAISTKAAIAGLTETKTAAAGGLAVVNAYGESIENLGLRYDQMFLAVRDGVTTFPELAQFLGDVLPTAKAAGVGFDEVSAAIARMTIAGIRTPAAVTALKGAINALAAPTPDAQKQMDALGITWKGLTATLEDIASKKLGLDAMRQLIPDVEARTAVLSLTQDIKAMRDEVTAMGEASGAMESAYQKMSNTPQADLDRFNAALAETKLQLGEAATAFLPVVEAVGEIFKGFNSLPEPIRVVLAVTAASGALFFSLGGAIRALRNPLQLFLGHLQSTPAAATASAAGMEKVAGAATNLIPTLGKLATVGSLMGGVYFALVGWTGSNLMALYDLYQQNQELTKSQQDYEKSLSDTIAKTTEYASVVIQPAEALARMNDEERKAYAESLRLAEQHYRSQMEIISRRDMQRDGPTAPASNEAMAAARRAREFREALEKMNTDQAAAAEALEASEKRHNDNMEKIRADNLAKLQVALAAQMRAYEAANKKLEAAKKQREAVAKEFADLSKDMRAAPAGQASLGDVYSMQAKARQSLQKGDNEGALRQAREAAKVLRELKESGENGYGLAGLADQLGAIANKAAGNIEGDQAAKLALVKASMDEILAKADALKRVNIEFTGNEESIQALEQQALGLAERLKKYMIIPINYVGVDPNVASSEKDAGKIINSDPTVKRAAGGWIDGPGSPTSDSITLKGSRGEFVLQARSARMLGSAALEHMNRSGTLPPGRADLVPYIPALPELDRVGERQPMNLAMPWGGSYNINATPAEAARLDRDMRRAAIKFGGTSND